MPESHLGPSLCAAFAPHRTILKTRDGNVEAIRALVVAKRSAKSTKIKTLNQIRHLGLTAPEEIRQSLARTALATGSSIH